MSEPLSGKRQRERKLLKRRIEGRERERERKRIYMNLIAVVAKVRPFSSFT